MTNETKTLAEYADDLLSLRRGADYIAARTAARNAEAALAAYAVAYAAAASAVAAARKAAYEDATSLTFRNHNN